jgi:hypothetical protein
MGRIKKVTSMFATTLTIAVDGVDKVLNRVNQDNQGSLYTLVSDTEEFSMQIRHSMDRAPGKVNVRRHNVFVERTIYATPVAIEKYWSTTYTVRERVGSGPTSLLHLSAGFLTLLGTLDNDLVVGVN